MVFRQLLGKTETQSLKKNCLMDSKVLLFSRNGIFQVRLYKGTRQYIYKSLKTRDFANRVNTIGCEKSRFEPTVLSQQFHSIRQLCVVHINVALCDGN